MNERAVEGSFDRDLLVRVRIFSMLVLWSLSAGIMLLRRAKGRLDPALPALFFPPFVVVALQPYGGEVLLRVAFFVLPAVAITLATTDWTSMAVSKLGVVAGRAVTIALLAAAVPVFILARFGNESYEAVLDDDLAITEVMYDTVPEGTVLFRANSFALSWVERVDEIRYRQLPDDLDDAVERIQEQAEITPTWILLTESQQNWGSQVQGWPQGWLVDFGVELEATGTVEVEARVGTNVLMRVLEAGP